MDISLSQYMSLKPWVFFAFTTTSAALRHNGSFLFIFQMCIYYIYVTLLEINVLKCTLIFPDLTPRAVGLPGRRPCGNRQGPLKYR